MNGNIVKSKVQMVNLMPSFYQLGPRLKRPLIMDLPYYGSFLKANHIIWLNDFFSRNFLNIIILKV